MIRQVDVAWAALGVVDTTRDLPRPDPHRPDRVSRIEPTRSRARGRRAEGRGRLLPQLRADPGLAGGA
jgi:hypothetical protein